MRRKPLTSDDADPGGTGREPARPGGVAEEQGKGCRSGRSSPDHTRATGRAERRPGALVIDR